MKPPPQTGPVSPPQKTSPATEQAPATQAAANQVPATQVRVYQPPAILWEQPFVALAQISTCPIPGESECVP